MTAVLATDIGRAERPRCAEHRTSELSAWHELLGSIEGTEWKRRTVCDEWDVADIAGHMIGQAEDVIRPLSFPRRFRKGRRIYPNKPKFDAHMMVQADEHRGESPDELRTSFDHLWAKATRKISRNPALIRRITMSTEEHPDFPLDLGYIQDILLARDLWMHRDDICQALDRPFDAGPYGEELIAQVMRDLLDGPFWGDRPAVDVELTGQAGGTYRLGRGEPVGQAAVDAVTYMRTLSGRDDNPLVTGDPEAVKAVAGCRMPF